MDARAADGIVRNAKEMRLTQNTSRATRRATYSGYSELFPHRPGASCRRGGGRRTAPKSDEKERTSERESNGARSLPAGRGAHVEETAHCQRVLGDRHRGNLLCVLVSLPAPRLLVLTLRPSLLPHRSLIEPFDFRTTPCDTQLPDTTSRAVSQVTTSYSIGGTSQPIPGGERCPFGPFRLEATSASAPAQNQARGQMRQYIAQ